MRVIMAAFAAALLSIGIAHAAKPLCDAGALDTSFGTGGGVRLTQPYVGVFYVEGMILDRKDRTVVGFDSPVDVNGNATLSLSRTTHRGLPDKHFGVDGRVAVATLPAAVTVTTTLAEDPTGRILFLVASNPSSPLQPDPNANATLTVYRLLENGQPDTTFGTGGSTVIGGLNSVFLIDSVASDADSRVLIAVGATNAADNRIETTLLRLTASGVLDATFGTGGMVQTALGTTGPDRATDVKVQTDGRILVLGRTQTGVFGSPTGNNDWDFFAMRFLSNGKVDASYGTNGSTIIDFGPNRANGRKGRLQSDGKLVIAGGVQSPPPISSFPTYAGWVRLNTDGSPDMTFGNNGQAHINIGVYGGFLYDVDIQDDGKIVGAVQEYLDAANATFIAGVMRINADGTLDSIYGGDGVAAFLPAGYIDSSGGYLRVDSKNRSVLSLSASTATASAPMLARFEPGKQRGCSTAFPPPFWGAPAKATKENDD
jgi:uncharacterized delta-60 repeat protein